MQFRAVRPVKRIFWIAVLLVIFLQGISAAEPKAGARKVVRGITLVYVPSGSFLMGTEEDGDPWFEQSRPRHMVTLNGFWIGATEVTQAQYKAVTGRNPSLNKGDDNRPVEQVSWFDAVDFCNKLSEMAGLRPCFRLASRVCDFRRDGFRLPTEAEWEYACRAGTTTRYYTGNKESDLDRAGWYDVNSGGESQPVGLKTPNAWGLRDMHGNVWEWCYDWYGVYEEKSEVNPTGPKLTFSRVLRGGGWHYRADGCSSAFRHRGQPEFRLSFVGFRVAMSAAEGQAR